VSLAPHPRYVGPFPFADGANPRRRAADPTEQRMEMFGFITNAITALLMGVAIGLERQFRQHPAGLRTNALVCLGASLFVSITHLMGDRDSPTRIASYIVSGIGFLGGGVILREGMNVKGMNTAATLWCSAAVGTLAGAGFPGHALIGTALVLSLHLGLRPVGLWVDARRKTAVDVETYYRLRVVCQGKQEGVVRSIIMRHVDSHPKMTVQSISLESTEHDDANAIVAEIFATERNDRVMQDLMSRLNIETCVTSVRWEKPQGQGV
jgi:putative Mg2+ transporter-C (MgtC) family protein